MWGNARLRRDTSSPPDRPFLLNYWTTVWDEKLPSDIAGAANVEALIAEEVGDLKGAVSAWDRYATAFLDPYVSSQNTSGLCWAAMAYEKAGQTDKANAALISAGAIDHPDCFRFKADALESRGDWVGAQDWYEKAARLAPSYPATYYSWGVALAKHKDLAGAAEQFWRANLRGPTWADPLKAWGDVLVNQGKIDEAHSKYEEALKYAPNWKQLKDALEALTKH
jgi:tetratricopeptide (TPR) repeat protein